MRQAPQAIRRIQANVKVALLTFLLGLNLGYHIHPANQFLANSYQCSSNNALSDDSKSTDSIFWNRWVIFFADVFTSLTS